MQRSTPDTAAAGVAFGLGAYLIWGFLPVLLKLLGTVPASEILAHRILWSVVLLLAIVTAARGWRIVGRVASSPRTLGVLAITAVLIAVNWLVYIWAVNSGHVLAASLGYFINPLVNVALGVAVLGERLRRAQRIAVGLAAAGVLVLAVSQGQLPWISLTLACSFGLYGLLRKMAPVDALTGLLVETCLLAPLALIYVVHLQATGVGSFGVDTGIDLLLILSGIVTAIPLLLFAAAAKRLPYATVGLLQYLSPTIQFLLAILVYDEPLDLAQVAAFGFIWAGLAFYATDSWRLVRQPKTA